MIIFYKSSGKLIRAVQAAQPLDDIALKSLEWLFGNAERLEGKKIAGSFIGPRHEMITPWSTNAVEITQIMGIIGILRIEEFFTDGGEGFDPMLQQKYEGLTQDMFDTGKQSESLLYIDDIAAYNAAEGLALSPPEIEYLEALSEKLGRNLSDSEVFGFSQVNSEHCRHKIFNGTFIIDGEEMPHSLFDMIRMTSRKNLNLIVSAYKDNVAFIRGPKIQQFAPARQDIPDYFRIRGVESVISLKAETHNFPTTVEPFNGAATGSGGEIRDRMAGGRGSIPLAGTAVYMTSYPRPEKGRSWEGFVPERSWLYHDPKEILVKASNGASDFGNKFGQPLICGSVLTFEYNTDESLYAFDKVIMLAGGVGQGLQSDSIKKKPKKGENIIVMGGDNYRIGMGGGSVSSVATGEYGNTIELSAVQRSNPEMQKRVYNALRAMTEQDKNPVVSIHDHGAGGHLNSLSEIIEETGGTIDIGKLPVGDPTLSYKEIIGNESQERMGLVADEKGSEMLLRVSERERAPINIVGKVTGDRKLKFEVSEKNIAPIDLGIDDFFSNPPVTIMKDNKRKASYEKITYDFRLFEKYLEQVLQLEAVACKDWLTNKVDRSVTGRIAMQQTAGPVQLPLNNTGVTTMDYQGKRGIATSIGHAPAAGMVNPAAASRLAVAEALTNIIWAPLTHGIRGISLSANWMWPCRNPGEDARLYEAVEAISKFAIELGINIPTGKDSLSMAQKYPDGKKVLSPGTVIVSAVAEVKDVRRMVTPVLRNNPGTPLAYIDFSGSDFYLGGSSFAQVLGQLGTDVPDIPNATYLIKCFMAIQEMIGKGEILSGHDIGSGGLITSLLEMTFTRNNTGLSLDFSDFSEDIIKILFSEKPGIIIQLEEGEDAIASLKDKGIHAHIIGNVTSSESVEIIHPQMKIELSIPDLRKTWFRSSYLLDRDQSGIDHADKRYRNFDRQPLSYKFPEGFSGRYSDYNINPSRMEKSGIRAAIIREKGVNGDREMAWAMYHAGFDVKDVHMTDLVSGRETLGDVNFIVFVGGFSNSDVLGSAKGWAGAFLYNQKAREALDNFYAREDTLSLGVCNGCQLMMELGLVNPGHEAKPAMEHNASGKFESAFINVDIPENHSVMLNTLKGSSLGIWVAHGEGKFNLPEEIGEYHVPMKYSYNEYPGNPNGSDHDVAALCSDDGRHLAMMPHLERAFLPWQWAYYAEDGAGHQLSPWMEAFVNAREWVASKI